MTPELYHILLKNVILFSRPQPAGLPNYEVPPPLLEPTTSAPEVHMLQKVGPESIPDDPIKMIESDGEEDEMLVDFNMDGNIFDLFNNFHI